MDFDRLKLTAAFLKWIDGDPITAQEAQALTSVFVSFPPVAASPGDIQGIFTRFAQEATNAVKSTVGKLTQ